MPTFLASRVDVTPSTVGAWTDIDDANVPAGAAGVILYVVNSSATNCLWGFRKNGSTDNRTQVLIAGRHCWASIGVDADGVFEFYMGTASTITVYLMGYYSADEAVFNTNATNASLSTTDSWTDIDINVNDGAKAAIIELQCGGSAYNFGLRCNGSTDSYLAAAVQKHQGTAIVGVDADEIFEGYIAHTDIKFWLSGYIKSNFTACVNALDRSPGSTGSWQDVAALPEGAIAGAFEFFPGLTGTEGGIRKNGSSDEDYYGINRHNFPLVECDGSRLVEVKNEYTNMGPVLLGYFTAAAGGAPKFCPERLGFKPFEGMI